MSYYDSVVLADGPVSFWKCSEPSGTTLADSGTGGNPLTISGAITLGATGMGDGETALQITTTSTANRATATPAQTISGPYSLELWVNPAVLAAGVMFSTRQPTDNSFDLQQRTAPAGFHGDIGTGAAWLSTGADVSVALSTGTWFHIVYVVTATGFTPYVNGVAAAGGSWASNTPLLWNTSHHIFIGSEGLSNASRCSIAKVAAYNYALTAAQIAAHYAARAGGPAPSVKYPTFASIVAYSASSAIRAYQSAAAIRAYQSAAAISAYSSTAAIRSYATSAAIRSYQSGGSITGYLASAAIVSYTTSTVLGTT